MFGSEMLEVAIGLIFIYLVLSLLCSAVREGIETFLRTRAAHLERGLRELLCDRSGNGLTKELFRHPLIFGLSRGDYDPTQLRGSETGDPGKLGLMRWGNRKGLPSYIPAGNFALALLDLAARGGVNSDNPNDVSAPVLNLDGVRATLANLGSPEVQRVVLTAIDTAEGDFVRAQASIEAWYNSGMDRVSGWYKRFSQQILLVLGIVVAMSLNANTVEIAKFLYREDAARAAIVAQAEVAASDSSLLSDSLDAVAYVGGLRHELDALQLPLGWAGGWPQAPEGSSWFDKLWVSIVSPLMGWIATGAAISLGAPFWFDLLNKVMVIRSTVKPHEKSPEEGSEDRQSANASPPPHLGGPPPRGVSGARGPGSSPPRQAQPLAVMGGGGESFDAHEWVDGDPREGVL